MPPFADFRTMDAGSGDAMKPSGVHRAAPGPLMFIFIARRGVRAWVEPNISWEWRGLQTNFQTQRYEHRCFREFCFQTAPTALRRASTDSDGRGGIGFGGTREISHRANNVEREREELCMLSSSR